MEENLASVTRRPRFLTLLFGVFAAMALVLAAVGTYGVMSYSVAERSHEIGIRMAMGARAGNVIGLVMAGGLSVAVVGLVLGTVGAMGVTRFMRSMLFGITATDTTTFVTAPVVLAAVAVAACLIPAWRAARTDPAKVLRED
jgi:ABC-type antimicrobial peptide transport system permease subunit